MTRMRAVHSFEPADVESIRVEMNWLETLYPSPAFPNPQRGAPGVGSTHYFAAYTCVHGAYPPLRERIDPGDASAPGEQQVADLMRQVEVVGQESRGSFAPRITIALRDGTRYQDEFQGDELKWDLATETRRIRELFPNLGWPTERLEAIVQAVESLESQPKIDPLIGLCVGP
jgi:hypothetical protein